MGFRVMLSPEAEAFLNDVDNKTERIVRNNLEKLANDPHPRPGSGRGDREAVTYKGQDLYRMHVGRSYTAIYDIQDDVLVLYIETISDAHKHYG